MSRVQDIIEKVRNDILLDPSGDRWDTPTLLRLITSGINDFLLRTKCSKARMYVTIENNIVQYNVGPYSQKVLRVEYNGSPLIVKSIAEMDQLSNTWAQDTGDKPLYVIFENLPAGSFRIYPRVPTAVEPFTIQNSLYGALIDVDLFEDLAVLPLAEVDIGTDMYLIVTYIKKQPVITVATNDLVIDNMYDDALAFYISGMALVNDKDDANVALGSKHLAAYETYVTQASQNESESNHAIPPREIPYRGFL